MITKEKILAALDCALEDVGEDRLIDILLDAYKSKLQRIKELEAENASERERLHREREAMQTEIRRMRSDPLYCASGDYFFIVNNRKFCVRIQGFKIEMFERSNQIDYAAQQLSPNDWLR